MIKSTNLTKYFILICFLTCFVSLVEAEDWPADWNSLIPTVWNWSVQPWTIEADSTAQSGLANKLPKLFASSWDSVKIKKLTQGEKIGYQIIVLRKALVLIDQTETKAHLQDDLAKLGTGSAVDSKTYTTIADLRKLWAYFHDHPDRIPIPDTLEVKRIGDKDSSLAPMGKGPPGYDADQLGSVLLFWGHLKIIGNYWSVTIGLWNTLENRNIMTWEDRFSPEEVDERLALAHSAFQESFLGHPWAGIEVSTQPIGALISLNGAAEQTTPLVMSDAVPGKTTLRIRAVGYQSLEKTLELKAGEVLKFAYILDKATTEGIKLVTDPAGADIWVDSQWLGLSPLTIPKPFNTVRVKAALKDHTTVYADVDPKETQRLIFLPPAGKAPDRQAAKDRFYWSLAFFSLGLTTTIAANVFENQYATLAADYSSSYASSGDATTYKNWDKAYRIEQGLDYFFWGDLALTSCVFVWMMFELNNYINTSDPQ